MTKVALLGLVMAVFAISIISAAEAHSISASRDVFNEGSGYMGNHRLWARSLLDHPNYIEGELRNYDWWCYNAGGGTVCGWRLLEMSAGNLALRVTMQKWNGSQWVICADTNWMYNSARAWGMSFGGWGTLCGNGYYGNNTGAYVLIGYWRGGWVWSGYQWLP